MYLESVHHGGSSIHYGGPSVMWSLHSVPQSVILFLITHYLSTVTYSRFFWMGLSTITFILFSCSLTPWVHHLILRTDLWSDGLAHPLGNMLWLTSHPRAINAVGTRGMFLMVTHSNQSVPSSLTSFPLYICCFFISFFTFCNEFPVRKLSSSLSHHHFVYLVRLSSTPSPLPSSHH